jgi:hypothetical protein
MIRILYWNVNNFSRNKIWNDHTTFEAWEASQDRLRHMIQQVIGRNVPDIVVIVEIQSRIREVGMEGTQINPNANNGAGVISLLAEMRDAFGEHWSIVPPLNLGMQGRREAMAVLYDTRVLQFGGPWVLYAEPARGGAIPWSQPPTTATFAQLANYDQGWLDELPHPNNSNAALQLNRSRLLNPVTGGGAAQWVNEWQLAGQWAYYTVWPNIPFDVPPTDNNRVHFPNADSRAPFLTHFTDLSAGANNRLIKLYALHTSPNTSYAGVRRLSFVPEIQFMGNNEVSVIVGDFNVDTFDPNAWGLNGPYQFLLANNYRIALDSRYLGNINANRRPYCLTHLLTTANATPFNNSGGATDPRHNVYPRYGYMGSMGGDNFQTPVDSGAIDNVFTRYGLGAGGPAANITIVNTVAGRPYDLFQPVPNGVTNELTGGFVYPPTLANALPAAGNNVRGGVNPDVDNINFTAWQNFGVIHSTSDHLALVIDV